MPDRFEVVPEDGANVGSVRDIGHTADGGQRSNQSWTSVWRCNSALTAHAPEAQRDVRSHTTRHEARTLHQPFAIFLKEVGQE